MKMLRKLLIKIFRRYYFLLPIPEAFNRIAENYERTIVITKYQSVFVQALLESYAIRHGLKGTRSLHEENGSISEALSQQDQYLRFVAVRDDESLVRLTEECPDVELTTLNIFRGRGPIRHSPRYRINIPELIAMLFGPVLRWRFLVILFGEPLQLRETEHLNSRRLSRRLRIDFYQNLRMVRGTPFQPFHSQERVVLGGHEYDREIGIVATRLGLPLSKVKRMARNEFHGTAANPRAPMYIPAAFIAKLLKQKLFTKVVTQGLDRFADLSKRHTVVLVPMHRSHLDYVLVGSTLYDANLNPPLVAAGINLRFWPVGFIIRSLGGYFVKRNARNDRIHAMLLRRYVSYLVQRGHVQEFFIEGGRSRSGKMRPPKLGLMNIFVSAYVKGLRKDVLFVPVSITYEHVIEEKVFGDENTGKSKIKEDFFALLRAFKVFQKKYGEVVIRFGEAVPIAPHMPSDQTSPSAIRRISGNLATELTTKIRSQSAISLTGLSYSALLMAPRYGLLREELQQTVRNLAKLANLSKQVNPQLGDFTESLRVMLATDSSLPREFVSGGIVKSRPFLNSEVYFIQGSHRFQADFYKNSVIHVLFPFGLLSIAHLLKRPLEIQSIQDLFELFQDDFQLGAWEPFAEEVDQVLAVLEREAIVGSKDGKRVFLNLERGIFIPGLLQSSIQTLLWILQSFQHYPESLPIPRKEQYSSAIAAFPYQIFLKELQNGAEAGKYLNVLSCTEATSRSHLVSCLDSLKRQGKIAIEEMGGGNQVIVLLEDPTRSIQFLKKINTAILQWQADTGGMGAPSLEREQIVNDR